MRLFKNVFSGDEMFSDSYKFTVEHEGACLEAQGKFITKKNEAFANIGGEDAEVAEDDQGTTVVDIVDAFRYNVLGLDKAGFMAVIKEYMKRMVQHLTDQDKLDRIPQFKKGATAMVQYIVKNFDEIEIFAGESFDSEAGLIFSFMKEGYNDGPTIWFFMDGLKEEKV